MPNLPISQLPQSATLQGDELFVDVQGGTTKYTTLDSISAYATSSVQTEVNNLTAVTSSYLTSVDTGSFVTTSSLDDHTITFTKADGSQYSHLLPGGQGSPSANHYLIPEFITINGTSSTPYPHFYLTGSVYEDTAMIKVDWTGANGTAHIVLPDASSDTNRYRSLRLTMGADFSSNTKGILFADVDNLGQTLDGSTGGYTLSKPYEGIMVWSDGSNWIRIQTKA